jgi:tetratricopeptide (TPR) repeat protein
MNLFKIIAISLLVFSCSSMGNKYDNNHKSFEEVKKLFDKGMVEQKNNNDKKAIKIFNEAILINKNHPALYDAIGNSFVKLGKKKEALMYYDTAIKINRKYKPAYINKITFLMQKKEFKMAIKSLKKMADVFSFNFYIHYNLGICYAKYASYNKAVEEYSSAISIRPKNKDSYYNRAISFLRLRKFSSAIDDLNSFLVFEQNKNSLESRNVRKLIVKISTSNGL